VPLIPALRTGCSARLGGAMSGGLSSATPDQLLARCTHGVWIMPARRMCEKDDRLVTICRRPTPGARLRDDDATWPRKFPARGENTVLPNEPSGGSHDFVPRARWVSDLNPPARKPFRW
jgi:hypothetical protein